MLKPKYNFVYFRFGLYVFGLGLDLLQIGMTLYSYTLNNFSNNNFTNSIYIFLSSSFSSFIFLKTLIVPTDTWIQNNVFMFIVVGVVMSLLLRDESIIYALFVREIVRDDIKSVIYEIEKPFCTLAEL